MSQPRAVLIVGRRFSANGVCRRATGRFGESRSTDECAASPAEPRTAARARQTPEHGRRCVSAFLEEARRVKNACNLHRCVGELELRPGRGVVELGRAGARRRHSNGCRVRPDSRSGALAPLSPSALVAAPLASSSLVVLTTKGGPGRASARSVHPTTIAGRVSRRTAAMKLARASASLILRGSST
jgi:hypothetical protein